MDDDVTWPEGPPAGHAGRWKFYEVWSGLRVWGECFLTWPMVIVSGWAQDSNFVCAHRSTFRRAEGPAGSSGMRKIANERVCASFTQCSRKEEAGKMHVILWQWQGYNTGLVKVQSALNQDKLLFQRGFDTL